MGAGGIGGYFGARLIQSGVDVTFLLRDKRHAKIKAEGLVIETPKETFTVKPKAITKDQLKPEYDLIVLAPKSFDFADALASLEGASSKGVFLPFLNGLDHIHQLDDRYGKDRVMVIGLPHMKKLQEIFWHCAKTFSRNVDQREIKLCCIHAQRFNSR